MNNGNDTYIWRTGDMPLMPGTAFSTKRTWEILRPKEQTVVWTKAVWFGGHVPKHAFNFWVASLDRLPVRARLFSWGVAQTNACCTCDNHSETRDHLLLHCEFSSEVLYLVLHRLGMPRLLFVDWSTLLSWLLSHSSPSSSTKLKRLVAHTTIYMLWRERNNRLHNSSSATAAEIFKMIDRSVRDTLLARRKRKAFANLLSLWFTYA
ncbi:hypothetical protein V5N11_022535 [Cardamine amara subsp. amara]|uniref:Reverse transcriptase zinc-binding domain-containing protein n=1 Tax=Cardamine amara subsp. amara TaxID=228776 RepID=A0ABD1B3U0_CARAN